MTGRVNMRFPDIGVAAMQVDTAAGATRARSGLNERRDKARVAPYLARAAAKQKTTEEPAGEPPRLGRGAESNRLVTPVDYTT